MASDPLFTQEIVREFISAQGGQVTNPVLVAHFRNFLNDPVRKVANRQLFKTYINTLANVKLDESGVKILALKKKFREGNFDNTSMRVSSSEPDPPSETKGEPKTSEAGSALETETLREDPVISTEEACIVSPLNVPLQPIEVQPQSEEAEAHLEESHHSQEGEGGQSQSEEAAATRPDIKNVPQEMTDETSGVHSEASKTPEVPVEKEPVCEEVMPEDREQDLQASEREETSPMPGGAGEIGESISVVSRGLSLAANYFLGGSSSESKETSFEEAVESELARGRKSESLVDGKVPAPSSDDVAVGSMDKSIRTTSKESSEPHILRVKDAAMNIQRMENEKSSQLKGQLRPKRDTRKPLGSDSNNYDVESMTMTDVDREWLLSSCRSDYHHMCKILQTHPHLAAKRDFITGYNALHWACKNGHSDIVKLLCGKYSVDPNIRTSGGYTALHLAAMMGHEEILELLVKVYKANANTRDYSGRLAKFYMGASASKRSVHLVAPRRIGNQSPSLNSTMLSHDQSPNISIRSDKENSRPSSLVSSRPFQYQNYSDLMPPPTKLPPVKRKPTSSIRKNAHSDSETGGSQLSLNSSSMISGSSPNFETDV